MATPDSPSAYARTLCSHLQPRAREESARSSTCPRLKSAPGPTRPCLKSAPGPIRPRPFPCVRPKAFAPAPAAARRVHTRSHVSAPGVRARSHPSAPFTMHSRPTRSRSYQRVHAGNQCAPAIISRWRPLQPRAPLAIYKPVGTPS
jgi:hypothetical protein